MAYIAPRNEEEGLRYDKSRLQHVFWGLRPV